MTTEQPTAFRIVKEIINYKGDLPLSTSDKLVLAKIATHMNYKSKKYPNRLCSWPSQTEIGLCCCDMTERNISNIVKKLEKLGIIAVVRKNKETNYYFWIGFPEEVVVEDEEDIPDFDPSILEPRKVVIVVGKPRRDRPNTKVVKKTKPKEDFTLPDTTDEPLASEVGTFIAENERTETYAQFPVRNIGGFEAKEVEHHLYTLDTVPGVIFYEDRDSNALNRAQTGYSHLKIQSTQSLEDPF